MVQITPRGYQSEGVTSILDCFKRLVKRVIYVLPTGGGKTVLFSYVSQLSSLKGKKVIILVHRSELLEQASKTLTGFGIEHGLVSPDFTPSFTKNIQVASVQTLINRLGYFTALGWEADIIISDECHHATAGSWRKVIEHFVKAYLLGVTGTPIRTDGQGLGSEFGGMFDEMVIGPQASWLMDEGYLVRAKVFGPPEDLDFSTDSKNISSSGEFKESYILSKVDKPKITGDLVDHYRDICNIEYKGVNVPALVFCVNIEHSEHVAQRFRESGYRFYSVDGKMDKETRKLIIQGLTDGTVEGITSCDLIGEGTDIPRATCEIDARPTNSKGLKIQHDGRVLRPVYADGYDLSTKEGRLAAIASSEKPFAVILDHVGNTQRHGFSWVNQQWSLEGEKKSGRKKAKETPVRVVMCESCFMQQEPAFACVSCGHIMKAPKDNTPKTVEGKLREITEADVKIKYEKKSEVAKSDTLEALVKIAEQRGYKPEWANKIYMARQAKLEKLKPLEAVAPPPPITEFSNLDF